MIAVLASLITIKPALPRSLKLLIIGFDEAVVSQLIAFDVNCWYSSSEINKETGVQSLSLSLDSNVPPSLPTTPTLASACAWESVVPPYNNTVGWLTYPLPKWSITIAETWPTNALNVSFVRFESS